MEYGPFSLSNTTAAELRYKLWLNSEAGYDLVCGFASIDESNWYGLCTAGNSGGWIDRVLDLSNVYTLGNLLGQPNIWIAIYFHSDNSNTFAEGGYVDDISLRKMPVRSNLSGWSYPDDPQQQPSRRVSCTHRAAKIAIAPWRDPSSARRRVSSRVVAGRSPQSD